MEGERKRERETLLSYCQASVCLRHTESSQGGVYNQLAAINSPQHVPCQHTLGEKNKTKILQETSQLSTFHTTPHNHHTHTGIKLVYEQTLAKSVFF